MSCLFFTSAVNESGLAEANTVRRGNFHFPAANPSYEKISQTDQILTEFLQAAFPKLLAQDMIRRKLSQHVSSLDSLDIQSFWNYFLGHVGLQRYCLAQHVSPKLYQVVGIPTFLDVIEKGSPGIRF